MSGPICPDCGGYEIKEGKEWSCGFCGWKGAPLPRKILSSSMWQSRGDRIREKKELREKGELFFVRVYVTEDADIALELMDIFELSSMNGAKGNPRYYYFEVNEKPDEETISKVKNLKVVKEVKIN